MYGIQTEDKQGYTHTHTHSADGCTGLLWKLQVTSSSDENYVIQRRSSKETLISV